MTHPQTSLLYLTSYPSADALKYSQDPSTAANSLTPTLGPSQSSALAWTMTTAGYCSPASAACLLHLFSTQQSECWKCKSGHVHLLHKALMTFPPTPGASQMPTRRCPFRLSVISLTSSSPLFPSLPQLLPHWPSCWWMLQACSCLWAYYFLHMDCSSSRYLHGLLIHLIQSFLKSLSRRSLLSLLLLLAFALFLTLLP